jgi:hypothetical protein
MAPPYSSDTPQPARAFVLVPAQDLVGQQGRKAIA